MSSFRREAAEGAGSEQPQTISVPYPRQPAPAGQVLRIQIENAKLRDQTLRIERGADDSR
jgi:hypothetical protein